MKYVRNAWNLFDNYLLARWQNRPSTASFWYLPEPPVLINQAALTQYKAAAKSPLYLLDYRHKLPYSLRNTDGIIVLPYNAPVGAQVNPEAAFQYALGLHDQYCRSNDATHLNQFNHYANYFLQQQTATGLWEYKFDWYGSKAPWYSALAQGRGAAVMLRAWKLSGNEQFLLSAKLALQKFTIPTSQGGFLHQFPINNCTYFEEYPETPTGVINGFMATLMNIWELQYWLNEKWLNELWQQGIASLEKMLPYYSNGWWSLYDLDTHTPLKNVNSPRYHLLEIHYLQILTVLTESPMLRDELQKRVTQYNHFGARAKAICLKSLRKILYK